VLNLVSHIEEEHGLRKIFGPKRDEVTWELRELHNEELYDLYSLPNIWVINSRRMEWVGNIALGGGGGGYKVLGGKPGGKRPLLRHRHSGEDNIKMDLQEVGWGGAWTVLIWLGMQTGGGLL